MTDEIRSLRPPSASFGQEIIYDDTLVNPLGLAGKMYGGS
jgi:hypothetical protein